MPLSPRRGSHPASMAGTIGLSGIGSDSHAPHLAAEAVTLPRKQQEAARWPLREDTALSDANLSYFIWSGADLLRGDYKQSHYGKAILPFTVLQRLDCVLEPTKQAVLNEFAARRRV